MNGRRKYKVTIRVVDHPPSTTTTYHDTLSVERNEQKTDPVSEDNKISSGIKSVYKSSVSMQVSDKQSHSCVRNSPCCASLKGCKPPSTAIRAGHHGRNLNEDMLHSESFECLKPLLTTDKKTSLNINKLTRNNAIDQEELGEQPSEVTNNIVSCECRKPVSFNIPTEKLLNPQTCSSADITAKYGVYKPRNGFFRQLPIVVLNSAATMEEGSMDNNVTNNAIGNGIQDDFLPDFDACGTRTDRPPLNREGSACSSDSIITEIDGFSDEEGELKGCSNDICDGQEV